MLNKENTTERIKIFKEDHIYLVTKIVENFSYLVPQLSILLYDNIKDDYGVTNYDIPGELLDSDIGKNALVKLIPKILNEIHKVGQIPLSIGWSTEAWIRVSDGIELPKNWKDLPKTEGIVNYFEDEGTTELITYTIIRDGSRINKTGNIIDNVRLELHKTSGKGPLEGRLTNLFKSYLKGVENG